MRHRRVVVTRYGGPEVITAIEEDIPSPTVGEVRVKVLAAGVSLPDVLAREGVHPETPRVPYTPGWDLVGTVDQLGEGVAGRAVADRTRLWILARLDRVKRDFRILLPNCYNGRDLGQLGLDSRESPQFAPIQEPSCFAVT